MCATADLPGFPSAVRIHVHWGEMDALGHVNNASLFRWFETSRIEAMRQLGVAFDPSSGTGPILAETGCTYHIPIRAPVEVVVGTRVGRVGRTSVRLEHGVALASDPSRLVAEGYAVAVWLDYRTGRPIPLPEAFRMEG
ncbi:MAG: acyl-CoA thioesterase [Deltaproteobacteria bacterium]|nr:acyl-CoA thioesterase [Deltaproteobacteria bacterium]